MAKILNVFVHVPKCAGNTIFHWAFKKIYYFGHSPLIHIKSILGDGFKDAFIFSVVRNPYDRLLSAYTYLKRPNISESWRSIWGQRWTIQCVSKFATFKDFVLGFDESLKRELHFRQQYEFLYLPPNTINVNLLIKFETLSHHWETLKEILKIEEPIPTIKRNETEHLKWQDIYTDEMMKIVAHHYSTDFKVFGYDTGR